MDKTNPENRCVYTVPTGLCPGTAPLHPKEHYLPAGLGNFEGDIRLRNFICYDCQARFAQLEEVFLRNSTEAFFRKILGVQGRKNHSKKNIFIEPTLGFLGPDASVPCCHLEAFFVQQGESVAKLLIAFIRKSDEGTIGKLIIEAVILLSARTQAEGVKTLRTAAQVYGVDIDPVVLKVKQEFTAKEKARKDLKSHPKVATKTKRAA